MNLRGVRLQYAVEFLFGGGVSSKVDCSVESEEKDKTSLNMLCFFFGFFCVKLISLVLCLE